VIGFLSFTNVIPIIGRKIQLTLVTTKNFPKSIPIVSSTRYTAAISFELNSYGRI
jgi:hypothetical protein